MSPEGKQAEQVAETAAEERKKMAGRAGVVALGTFASRALGFARDVVLAALFTREVTDAFFVAFTIPNALRQILGEGAVASAVMPVLGKKLEEGDAPARRFFARIRGVSLVVLTLVSLAGVLLAEPLTELFASGAHAHPGQFERTTALTRTVFPYIFFMGIAALGMAALNAKRRFAVAAFAPGLLNVAFLAAAFLLVDPLRARGIDGAQALAIGALVGGFLQVVAQVPALRSVGFAGTPILDLKDPGVRDVLRRLGPMTFGIGVYYIDVVLSRRLLSELGTGAQSWFTWAQRLADFPQGLFVMAISSAALPALATLAARGDTAEMKKTWAHGLGLSLYVAVPCSVALMSLGEPLVALFFQRGAFDRTSTVETARALFWQGGAIFTVAAVRQTVPVFYALGDTRTPTLVSALDLLVFVAMAIGLRGAHGHVAVSMAIAGSSAAQLALLLVFLRAKIGPLGGRAIVGAFLGTVAASTVAGVGAWAVTRILSGVPAWGQGILGGVAFVVLFVVAAWGLRVPEQETLLAAVGRRIRR